MKKLVFLRCFLIALLSSIIIFVAGTVITYTINRSVVEERLITETKLAAVLINDREDFVPLEAFEKDESFRITIISKHGEVLYDSDTNESLDNHITI